MNLNEERGTILKNIIIELHNNGDTEKCKAEFELSIVDYDPFEIETIQPALTEAGLSDSAINKIRETYLNEWAPKYGPADPDFEKNAFPVKNGSLTPELANLILNTIPVDLCVLNERDEMIFYTPKEKRMLPRDIDDLGKKNWKAHPPRSIPRVKKALEIVKSGSGEIPTFWFEREGQFIYARYFALRDEKGEYKGCLEVSQDIADIRKIGGEQRASHVYG